MSERAPTKRQYDTLRMLGSGAALVTGRKANVEPLLRHGWVTAEHDYAWVRITANGLRALASAVEKYGLPEMIAGEVEEKVCVECERSWRPRCRCGSRRFRFATREVIKP